MRKFSLVIFLCECLPLDQEASQREKIDTSACDFRQIDYFKIK